jgi:hypothetical protein
MSAGRTGGSAFGALRWVRFPRSLTFGFVGDTRELQVLRFAQDDIAFGLLAGERLDDVAMLGVARA